MKLAVLADIHGNITALEAVLHDLASVGAVDHVWVLGDLAAFGTHPNQCLTRLRNLVAQHEKGVVKVIGGNADRYAIAGRRTAREKSAKTAEELAAHIDKEEVLNTVLIWTMRQLAWDEYEFMVQACGQEVSLRVPGYGTVIGVHAVPGDDEGNAFLPTSTDEEALDALLDREGRLVLAGHTHQRMDRSVGRWRIVNPGSVGMSYSESGRAEWALITFEGDTAQVELRGVSYDVDAVIAETQRAGYPVPSFLAEKLRPSLQSS